MDSTLLQLLLFACCVWLSSAQTASSADGTIKYIADRAGGKSCDEVCQGSGLVCTSKNHGFPSDNVVPIFKKVGIDCIFDNFDSSGDDYGFQADPKYGIGGLDAELCKGFKNVPNEIKCDAKPSSNAFGRLCPCKVASTTTEPPTTAVETTQAPTTSPTTQPQTTEAETTQAPTTSPTTQPQTTEAETTQEARSTTQTSGTTAAANTPQSDGLTVQCSSESIVAILDLVKYPNMDTDTMMLDDSSCKAATVNATHAVIKTPLDGCNTTHNSSKDYLHYYNTIRITRKKSAASSPLITREHEALFPFQCSYDRNAVLSVVSYSPRRKLIYTRVADYGNFTFTMDMYENDQYGKAYDKYPVIVNLGQRLYLEVKAESKDSNLVLFAQKCFATPSNDVSDVKHYDFIENGCSKDSTLRYSYNNHSSVQRFDIESFRFLIGNTDQVHLHCELVVCRESDTDSLCAKGCQSDKRRKRRSAVKNPPREMLSVGPVNFAQAQSAYGVANGPVSVTTVAAIAGCLALLALVLIAAIVSVYRRRQTPRNCKSVLLVQQE